MAPLLLLLLLTALVPLDCSANGGRGSWGHGGFNQNPAGDRSMLGKRDSFAPAPAPDQLREPPRRDDWNGRNDRVPYREGGAADLRGRGPSQWEGMGGVGAGGGHPNRMPPYGAAPYPDDWRMQGQGEEFAPPYHAEKRRAYDQGPPGAPPFAGGLREVGRGEGMGPPDLREVGYGKPQGSWGG
eukprot:3333218-Rhodomonas_salina.1